MNSPKTRKDQLKSLGYALLGIGMSGIFYNTYYNNGLNKTDSFTIFINKVFVLMVVVGGVCLLGYFMHPEDKNAPGTEFFKSILKVVAKSIMFVILPAIIVTLVLLLIFLRN